MCSSVERLQPVLIYRLLRKRSTRFRFFIRRPNCEPLQEIAATLLTGGYSVSQRYQTGYLRRARRKSGLHVWEFLWRETDERGRRVHRTAIVGTVGQYPTEELAWTAANGLRVYVNSSRNLYSAKPISVGDLIDHYVHTDLSANTSWHSHATRTIYLYFLDRWIRPEWGEIALQSVPSLGRGTLAQRASTSRRRPVGRCNQRKDPQYPQCALQPCNPLRVARSGPQSHYLRSTEYKT